MSSLAILSYNLFLSSSLDGSFRIWDYSNKKIKSKQIAKTDSPIYTMVLVDKERVATGHIDGKIRLWNISSKSLIKNFHAHDMIRINVMIVTDGKLISGSDHGKLIIWNIHTGDSILKVIFQKRILSLVAISTDLLICGESDGHLTILNINNGNIVKEFGVRDESGQFYYRQALFPNGLLAQSSYRGIKIWNLTNTNSPVKIFKDSDIILALVTLSNDHFATGDSRGFLKIWNINSNEPEEYFNYNSQFRSLIKLPTGGFICGFTDNSVMILREEKHGNAKYITGEITYTPFFTTLTTTKCNLILNNFLFFTTYLN